MNQSAAKSLVRTVLLVLTLIGVMQTIAFAQSENSREDRIVGVWDVKVTLVNCETREPLFPLPPLQNFHFRGLHKYELGGTLQNVPSTTVPAYSPHVGVWKLVDKDLYRMSFKMFSFDANGTYNGWVEVRNYIALSEDGTVYRGMGQAEYFDKDGKSIPPFNVCPTFIGKRFE